MPKPNSNALRRRAIFFSPSGADNPLFGFQRGKENPTFAQISNLPTQIYSTFCKIYVLPRQTFGGMLFTFNLPTAPYKHNKIYAERFNSSLKKFLR